MYSRWVKHYLYILIILVTTLTCANAANCVWQGGTASWTTVNTASWSCGHVPTSIDNVFFDGSSGGGTVTLNFGGPITVISIDFSGFTGTWDNSPNSNAITVTGSVGFSGSAISTRTINLGAAAYTINGGAWQFGGTTGLTFVGNNATIIMANGRAFDGGSLTYGNVSFGAVSGSTTYIISGANTFNSVSISPPNHLQFPQATTQTISTAFSWNGASNTSPIEIRSALDSQQATIAAASGSTATKTTFRNMAFTGSPVATASFNLSGNSGISISAVGLFGNGACILGGWLLWRDLPDHINDNFPVWLNRAS